MTIEVWGAGFVCREHHGVEVVEHHTTLREHRYPVAGTLDHAQAIELLTTRYPGFEAMFEIRELNAITLLSGPGTEIVFRPKSERDE